MIEPAPIEPLTCDERARLILEIESVRAQQQCAADSMARTTLQRLRGARGMLDTAIDHAERASEPDATDEQRLSRRSQSASAIARAIALLAEAGAYATMALCGETDSFSTRRRK